MAVARGPILGVDLTAASATLEFPLGTRVVKDNVEYEYGQANGAVATQLPCSYATGGQWAASGNAGDVDGVSVYALADNEYGWFAIRGEVTCNVAGSTAAGAYLTPVADANGDMVTVAGATNVRRGLAVTAESGGLSTVRLY